MIKTKELCFHIVSVLFLAISFSMLFWHYKLNLSRLLQAVEDVKEAFTLWIEVTFTKEVSYKDANFVPEYNFTAMFDFIEFNIPEFILKIKNIPSSVFDGYNFSMFNFWFVIQSVYVLLYITIGLTVVTVIQTLLEMGLTTPSETPGEDTFFLKLFKKIIKPITCSCFLIYSYIKRFINSKYWFWFVFAWLFNFNLSAIVLEFLAFVFGFPLSADLNSFFMYIGMLISDIIISLASAPLFIWLIIFYVVFSKIRYARADSVMNHLYRYDVGFLRSCAYNVLLTGPTGASKTKTAVQMAIMSEDYYHTDQWDSMYKFFQEFPDFPFYDFEQSLKKEIENGVVNNMHTARNFVECLKLETIKNPVPKKFYNYTGKMYYNDGIRLVSIFEVLEQYAQLYYMYSNPSTSLIANLSVRSDLSIIPGHFPVWDNRLLTRKPEHYVAYSQYAHILNNNMFRFSKLVDDEPAEVNLEYGVNLFTELDKDQGNQNTNKIYDIKNDEANPLNDGYDIFLMLERHLGTVDFNSYIRNFADIQRDGTLREGVKGLYDELNITEKSEPKLAFPLFFEGFIYGKIDSWLSSFTLEVKNCGTVNTLPYYVLTRLFFPLANFVSRIKLRYTYEELLLIIKNACSPEGVYKQHAFYILYAIAHSNRYSTDCYAVLNDEAAKYSQGGIQDIPTYETLRPALHELPKQKSYFSKKQLERLERIKKQKRKK